jgi:hypothetical protein
MKGTVPKLYNVVRIDRTVFIKPVYHFICTVL